MSHQLLISVGSNINKVINTKKGILSIIDSFDNVKISTIYESEAVGFAGDNFYNLVVCVTSNLSVIDVCKLLKKIEDEHGRVRGTKYGNRTLDLDLLTYDSKLCHSPVLLPRPEIEYNAFVLKPMSELVPKQLHPRIQLSYAELWQDFINNNPNKNQRLWPAKSQWRADKNDYV